MPTFTKVLRCPLAVVMLVVAMTFGGMQAGAAPGMTTTMQTSMQNVDYLGVDSASQLDLGFTVLVPSNVPSPFAGEPAIDAGGGYYSLYWMVTGGPPTFLQVTGEVGGSLPAGSPYDLNNQLSVNASVQGYEAIHDVTPAYDTVWWIAGGVAYKVESLNMTGADSLGLANSLIGLVPPEPAPEAPVSEEPEQNVNAPELVDPTLPDEEPLPAPQPEPTAETELVGPGEPALDTEQEQDSVGPIPGDVAADITTLDEPVSDEAPPDDETSLTGTGSSNLVSDGTGSDAVGSDGTGGPALPVTGTDGTGGTGDVSLTP